MELILIDTAVQRLIADHAAKSGEDAAWLDEIFQVRGNNGRAPIRHAKGHHNHIHFRFHDATAETLGRRLAKLVLPRTPPAPAKAGRAEPAPKYAQHRARSGDTFVILARRYGTTVEAIQRANGLAKTAIRAGVVYRIPQKAAPKSRGRVGCGGSTRAPCALTPTARGKESVAVAHVGSCELGRYRSSRDHCASRWVRDGYGECMAT